MNISKFILNLIPKFFLLFTIACCEISCSKPQNSDPNYQLFIEPDAGRKPLLDAINSAGQEIDVVMYLFTDKKIAAALKQAAERGVKVNVLLEKAPNQFNDANEWLPTFWQQTPNLSWQWVPYNDSLNYYHQKTLIIDHKFAYIMTLNFTYSSFKYDSIERNFMLLDKNPTDVSTINNIFNADWHHQKPQLPNNTKLVLSPENSRTQITNLINGSKSSLKIYAIGLNDYDLIGALAKAAKRGVKVEILWDGKLSNKAANYLMKHHVILKQVSSDAENHAKLIMSDHHQMYLGSANFTENSLDHNRELGIIIDDPTITQQADAVFKKDWG